MKMVSRGENPPRQDEPPLSDKAWDLIQWCWVRDAAERPAIEYVRKTMMAWNRHQPLPANNPGSAVLQHSGSLDEALGNTTSPPAKMSATGTWKRMKSNLNIPFTRSRLVPSQSDDRRHAPSPLRLQISSAVGVFSASPQSPGSVTSGSGHLGHKPSGRSNKSDSTNIPSIIRGSFSGASPRAEDEGKMSVAIDFGKSPCYVLRRSANLI